MKIEHYEVFFNKDGEWQLHGRYTSDQRQTALNDAKSMEGQIKLPCKVVKEQYDKATGSSSETVVYLSQRIREIETVKEIEPKNTYSYIPEETNNTQNTSEQNNLNINIKLGKNPFAIIVKIIFIAIVAAAIISGITALFMQTSMLEVETKSKILVTIFMTIFMLSFFCNFNILRGCGVKFSRC